MDPDELDLLKSFTGLEVEFGHFMERLVDYLKGWSQETWIDDDEIYTLAAEIADAVNLDVAKRISNEIEQKVSYPISAFFIAGLGEVDDKSEEVKKKFNPKYSSNVDFFTTPIRDALLNINNQFMMRVHYAESSGNYIPLNMLIGDSANNLLNVANSSLLDSVFILLKYSLYSILSEPHPTIGWNSTIRALIRLDEAELAELTLWEAIRRFPNNSYLRGALSEVLHRSFARTEEAIALQREYLEVDPLDFYNRNRLARFLYATHRQTENLEAIKILIESIELNSTYGDPKTVGVQLFYDIGLIWEIYSKKKVIRSAISLSQILNNITLNQQGIEAIFFTLSKIWRRGIPIVIDFLVTRRHIDQLTLANIIIALLHTEAPLEPLISYLAHLDSNFINDSVLIIAAKMSGKGGANKAGRYTAFRKYMAEKLDVEIPEYAELADGGADTLHETEKVDRYDFLDIKSIDPSLDRSFAIKDEISNYLPIFDQESRSDLLQLPTSIQELGRLRRIRFWLENGGLGLQRRALDEIAGTQWGEQTIEYAALLAKRYGAPLQGQKNMNRLEGMPGLALAFEEALESSDLARLDLLSSRFLRIQSLILIVKAALGHEEARMLLEERIDDIRREEEKANSEVYELLRYPLLLIDNGVPLRKVLDEEKHRIIAAARNYFDMDAAEKWVA
jgi:hypothetical protein